MSRSSVIPCVAVLGIAASVALVVWAGWGSGSGAGPRSDSETESAAGLDASVSRSSTDETPAALVGRGMSPSTNAKPAKKAGPSIGIGRHTTPPAGAAIFPDGTWLPPLNGVKFAPHACPWPKDIPYSPVIKIVTGDKGIQWYIHADGSHSGTQLAPTEQGGRKFLQPGWVVGNPTKAMPVQLGSGAGPVGGPKSPRKRTLPYPRIPGK